ncbi:MAG: hypothetical protein EBT13_05885, partial [Rhodobacteraceae bacterium]|nr:hypothetical protein [Paracoccaceae bacterium]
MVQFGSFHRAKRGVVEPQPVVPQNSVHFGLVHTDGGSTYKGFALESDCSFEMNAETREVTSKDDAVYRSYVTSAKNWTISGSALFGDDDASNWNPDD